MSSQVIGETAFTTKYILESTLGISRLKNKICDQTFWNDFALLFTNPSDYINSVKFYPFRITEYVGNTLPSRFDLGKIRIPEITARRAYNFPDKVNLLTTRINRHFNNFMDFEPYTKIDLYIPYFNIIHLPVNEVMGKTISVDLSVDFDTGIGTIYVRTWKEILCSSTKLGIDIPIGATNKNEVAKENTSNFLKSVAGIGMVAVGGAYGKTAGGLLLAKGLSTALTSGIDIVNNQQIRYHRGSTSGGIDMLGASPFYAIYVTRPKPIEIDSSYNHIKGKPLGEIKVLSTLRGFTIVDQIHLQNMPNALDEEMKEIESLLHSGVEL